MTPGSEPAKPSERRTGSTRNTEGSASDAGSIKFSEALESAISNMVTEHNAKMREADKPAWSRTSSRTVAAVVRRGMGAFSSSHRPGMNRQQWGLARARAFLHLLSTGKPKNSKYTTDNDLLPSDHPRSSKGNKADDMNELEPDVIKDQVESYIDEMILADVEDDLEEVDITDELTDEQIQELFDAFEDSDWDEVDRILDSFEKEGIYRLLDEKAEGGADRNRGGAEKLRRYWTVGKGGLKIRWGTDGDWTRCVKQLSKYLGPRAKGYCSLRHKEMNGYWPGDKRNKSDSIEDIGAASIYHESKQTPSNDLGEPMLEHKTVGVKGMNVVSENEGIVETIISVTGIVDNVKDRIMPGAYQKTLVKRKPKGVWSHDWDTPVSKTLDVKELLPGDPELPTAMPGGDSWPSGAGALKVKTQFNLETQRGREAYSDVVFFGDEQEWSIGYNVPVGGAKVDSKSGVREITMLELYEYSPVLFGAMPLARTTSVKQAQMALKALKGGGAAWLSMQEDMDEDEEVKEYTSDEMGEDEEDEDMEGKSRELSADQMILVKRAIDTLSDLLEVVQGVEAKGYGSMDKDEDEKGNDMSEMDKEVMPDEEKEGDEDYESLSDAVGDLFGDEQTGNFMKAAEAFDNAMSDEDEAAAEKAMGAFLDLVEDAMGDSDEMDEKLKDISEMIADMIESMGGEEEMPSEETIDKKMREDDMELEDIQEKREYSKESREEMVKEGMAMPDGSFPIKDEADLRNAIQAHGRAKDIDKAKAHIKKRAKELDLEDMIPAEWSEGKILINSDELKSLLDSMNN
jgi:hypothetical protein